MYHNFSIVVPVYNEEAVLQVFWARLRNVLDNLSPEIEAEVIFVDDGSHDSSSDQLIDVSASDPRVRVLTLSRNFGHQAALLAGLELAMGAAVVTIDADLQDPPEVIPELLERWLSGADVVLARRIGRRGESRFKRVSADLYYRALFSLSGGLVPRNTGDFRLLSREALNAVLSIGESSPYFRGIVAWIGYKRDYVDYIRDARFSGNTKYSFLKMFRLGLSGVTSFSERPLYMISLLGFGSILISLVGASWVLLGRLIDPDQSVSGYATTVLLIFFFGGVQLLSAGVLGAYLGVVSRNTKARPRYVIWGSRSHNLGSK